MIITLLNDKARDNKSDLLFFHVNYPTVFINIIHIFCIYNNQYFVSVRVCVRKWKTEASSRN